MEFCWTRHHCPGPVSAHIQSSHSIFSLSFQSLADDKFGTHAEQFMTHVKKQMGVHVFMMIGYKNEKGEMVRAKCVVHTSLWYQFSYLLPRLETPKTHPTEPAFLNVFNKSASGNEIWKEWDKFLEQPLGLSLWLCSSWHSCWCSCSTCSSACCHTG